jgi:RHS repeat-associated protein
VVFEAYQYDYQGHRIRKTSSAGSVRYGWDADRVIAETDDFGNVISKYDYAGDRLLAVHHVTEGEAFYLFDALGSPVDLVKADASIAVRYHYDAWGELTGTSGQCSNPFQFTGYQRDPATGLYYAKARFYDPEVGRFLTQDPVTGEITRPQSLNLFAYAYDNPTVYTDPDGRCVGALQKTAFCQAIAKGIAVVIAGDPVAKANRESEDRRKVVEGRRRFRQETGRDPRPDEVVWSDGHGHALKSDFNKIDETGRIEADHAELVVAGAVTGTVAAVGAARAAGASTMEQVGAAAAQLGDEYVGQVVGVRPSDVKTVANLAKRGLAPRPPPEGAAEAAHVTVVGESELGPGVDLESSISGRGPATSNPAAAQGQAPANGRAATVAENYRVGTDFDEYVANTRLRGLDERGLLVRQERLPTPDIEGRNYVQPDYSLYTEHGDVAAYADAKTGEFIGFDAQARGLIEWSTTTRSKTLIYYTPKGTTPIDPNLLIFARQKGVQVRQVGVP